MSRSYIYYIYLNLILFLIFIIIMLINVAFFTLLERKILGLSQSRKGPNKVGYAGLIQPLSDAVKLFLKKNLVIGVSNSYLFFISPLILFFRRIMMWRLVPVYCGLVRVQFSIIFILVFLRIRVYGLFFAGWRSNRKYAFLGRLRAIAQTISYEISLSFLLISFFLVKLCLSLSVYRNFTNVNSIFLMSPVIFIWGVCCLRESNRTPFDFSEGERELVSGFNVEYGRGLFALIFIAEYSSIILLSALSAALLMVFSSLLVLTIGLIFWWVWCRSTLPRFRYDLLMYLNWKSYLPIRTFMFAFYRLILF